MSNDKPLDEGPLEQDYKGIRFLETVRKFIDEKESEGYIKPPEIATIFWHLHPEYDQKMTDDVMEGLIISLRHAGVEVRR